MADVIFLIDNLSTIDQRQIIVLSQRKLSNQWEKKKLHLKLLFDQGQLDLLQSLIFLSFQFLRRTIISLKSSSKDLFYVVFLLGVVHNDCASK